MSQRAQEETLIKGASINARLAYVREKHGARVLESILAHVNEEDRAQLGNRILPSTQYPLALNARLDEAIAHVLDPSHPEKVFRALGRYSADTNLSSFHRIFLRGQGPHDVLRDFPSVRGTYYSDGTALYEETGDTSARFQVSGASSHSLADCESTAGYFEKAIELMGGTRVSVTLAQCRHHGDAHCEFVCQWR